MTHRRADRVSLIRNFISLVFVRGFDYIIPIITLPYLIGVLGIDGFGQVEFANSLAMYCAAVINYGFAITAVRRIALVRDNRAELTRIFSSTFIASTLLAFAMSIIFGIVVYLVPMFSADANLYWGSFLFAAMSALFPVWMFRGLENVQTSAIITTVARLAYLMSLFVFVRTAEDYLLVPRLHGYAMGLATLVAVFLLIRRIGFIFPAPSEILQVFQDGYANFIAQLMPNLYNNSATFLLGVIAGPTAVGIFSAARKVADVFNAVLLVGTNALFPLMMRRSQTAPRIRQYLLMAGVGLAMICLLTARYLSNLLFPDIASQVTIYLRWLTLGIVGYAVTLAYQQAGLLLMHRDREIMKLSVFTSVTVFIVGSGLIISGAGISGAVAMLVGARLGMAVASWFSFRKALIQP